MPTDNRGQSYSHTSSGTNSQGTPLPPTSLNYTFDAQNSGNHYCSRDYGSSASNPNSYHYSNSNGSYYYSNPNGSTYHNNGQGNTTYTPPSGGNGGKK